MKLLKILRISNFSEIAGTFAMFSGSTLGFHGSVRKVRYLKVHEFMFLH